VFKIFLKLRRNIISFLLISECVVLSVNVSARHWLQVIICFCYKDTCLFTYLPTHSLVVL